MGISSLKPAVFFDRDGVLNAAVVRDGKPYPPTSLDELCVDSAAKASVQRVIEAGFSPVMITNQPDVARGTRRRESVESMNLEVARQSGIDAVYACFHDDADGCDCRKPKPGLLLRAAKELSLDLSRSYFVGDREKDIVAGQAAGCRTVFIDANYSETSPNVRPDIRVIGLAEAVDSILEREGTL